MGQLDTQSLQSIEDQASLRDQATDRAGETAVAQGVSPSSGVSTAPPSTLASVVQQQKQTDSKGVLGGQSGVAPNSASALEQLSAGNSLSAADTKIANGTPILSSDDNGNTALSLGGRKLADSPNVPATMRAALNTADSGTGNLITAVTGIKTALPSQVYAATQTYQQLEAQRTPQLVAQAHKFPRMYGDTLTALNEKISIAKAEALKQEQSYRDGNTGLLSKTLLDVRNGVPPQQAAQALKNAYVSFAESDILHSVPAGIDPKLIHDAAVQRVRAAGIPEDGIGLETFLAGAIARNQGIDGYATAMKTVGEAQETVAKVKLDGAKVTEALASANASNAKARLDNTTQKNSSGQAQKMTDVVHLANSLSTGLNQVNDAFGKATKALDAFNIDPLTAAPTESFWGLQKAGEDKYADQRKALQEDVDNLRKAQAQLVKNKEVIDNQLMSYVSPKAVLSPPPTPKHADSVNNYTVSGEATGMGVDKVLSEVRDYLISTGVTPTDEEVVKAAKDAGWLSEEKKKDGLDIKKTFSKYNK